MKDGCKAFITIEVTLMIPVLMGCIFTMISMALYLYNDCLLQQNNYIVSMQVRDQVETTKTVEYQEIYNNLYHQKYLLTYDMEMKMKMMQNDIFIESSGKVASLGIEHFFLKDACFLIVADTKIENRNNYLILHTLKTLKNLIPREEEND